MINRLVIKVKFNSMKKIIVVILFLILPLLTFLIGGVSLIENNSIKLNSKNSIQLRGMCVYDKFQKQNVGLSLLNKAEELSKAKNFEYIWMNARKSALKFYLKKGYINNFESFNINNIGKHYFLFKKVK